MTPPTRPEAWYRPPEIGVCPYCGWPAGDLGGHVAMAHPETRATVESEPMLVLTIPPPRRPLAAGCAWFALGVCVGILLVALLMAVAPVLDAAPSSGQTTGSVDMSGTSSAAQSGASRVVSGTPAPRTVGLSSAVRGAITAMFGGWAAYCDPTPDHCQGWGGDVLVGAVRTFADGDEPYAVRVTAGDRAVVVRIVSHCACGDRHGVPTVIDLSRAAFARLADPALGIVRVEVEDLRS